MSRKSRRRSGLQRLACGTHKAAFLVVGLSLVLSLSMSVPAAANPPDSPHWRAADCPPEVDDETICGTLSVPVDHSLPDGPRLDIAVVRVPAAEPREGAVPRVDVPGGPGMPVTDLAGLLGEGGPFYELRRRRDLLLVDRRGTGQSRPLHCPQLSARHPLKPMYPVDQVEACRDQLIEAGHDLTQLGTEAAARDLDLVRRAFGYPKIDLWGLSYGTVLAQAYLRLYDEHVRAVVLVGAAVPDALFPLHHAAAAQRALDLIFAECRFDPACRAAYPDLDGDWRRLLARLAAGPIPVQRMADERGGEWRGEIRRDAFGEAFRGLLSTAVGGRRVPWIIHRAAAGDFAPLLAALPPPEGPPLLAEGLYLSVACPEATDRIDESDVDAAVAGTFLGRYRVDAQRAACAVWPGGDPPDSLFEPLRTDVPVLLLVGDLDYVTPPAWSYEIARRFPSSRVVVMPHGSHLFWEWGDDTGAAGCFDSIAEQFFESADLDAIDVSCAQKVEPPPFFVAPDVRRPSTGLDRE